ncbi:hypothetical protein M91_07947 [Bos mutus]|uniref:Proteasome subunit alpha type-2 n=1 Tax=Bos mutus TaxID=72004 RepID=L8I3Q8_9CETA|nr:hypothetical protein M91_07947 [Bos mutus]
MGVLVHRARKLAQQYYLVYQEPIPTAQLVQRVASVMQEYTQSGGVRPFGVSLLICGWNEGRPYLFQSDPSGAYFAWKATAMGKNYVNGKTFLEKRYNEDLELEDAIHTVILTLKESFEGHMTEDNIEVGICNEAGFRRLSPTEFGKPVQLLFHSHRVKGRKRDDKRLRSDQIITKIECILQIKGKNRMETEGESPTQLSTTPTTQRLSFQAPTAEAPSTEPKTSIQSHWFGNFRHLHVSEDFPEYPVQLLADAFLRDVWATLSQRHRYSSLRFLSPSSPSILSLCRAAQVHDFPDNPPDSS